MHDATIALTAACALQIILRKNQAVSREMLVCCDIAGLVQSLNSKIKLGPSVGRSSVPPIAKLDLRLIRNVGCHLELQLYFS